MKKEETNDIVQYLIPLLNKNNISTENCKIDVTTEKSGKQRGDIWISLVSQSNKNFENKITCLIEAKHRNSNIGDIDWRDAMSQGKEKAKKQKLNYYVVTNCKSDFRYYNVHDDEEIYLDGKILTKIVPLEILQKIQTQTNEDSSYVLHKASKDTVPIISEASFRKSLKNLANVYRSAGLKKGDERIDPTVSFVVLKYISEQELEKRTLHSSIKLWHELRNIAYSEEGDLKSSFKIMVDNIWDKNSEYKNNRYSDFKDLIDIKDSKLKNNHFKLIYKELDGKKYHGANFDLYGSIYEEFASQTKKKEFGEFYTRRHITGMVAKLLLRNELKFRKLKISDPACGTGGFLTEAYKSLITNYSSNNSLNTEIIKELKENVFFGYDNDPKSVARTKLNMFLVGDGHIHIYENDSLVDWESCEKGWEKDTFDYILTNPPMGKYDGEAKIENFSFTNEKRYELLFVERILEALKSGGELAVVINDGALEAPSRKNFRKKLLSTCNINAVISLSKFAFAPYTKEKTYILFLQKKQNDEISEIQKTPIWNYILDYDGYANSDKRYRTKYHDDIPELEENFDNALKLLKVYPADKDKFEKEKINYEREINPREKSEGLKGKKFGYVYIEQINEGNFFNLLSEFHLRPFTTNSIGINEFDSLLSQYLNEFNKIKEDFEKRMGKD